MVPVYPYNSLRFRKTRKIGPILAEGIPRPTRGPLRNLSLDSLWLGTGDEQSRQRNRIA